MKKSTIRWITIEIGSFVVFHVIIFAIPFLKTPTFWLSYAFTLVAMLAQIYIIKAAFYKEEGTRSKFYGFPIARLGVLYLGVQFALCLIFVILTSIAPQSIPLWIPLVLYTVLLGLAIIGLVGIETARDEIERQDIVTQRDVSTMRSFQSKVASLAEIVSDRDAAREIRDLSDAFRYSDPVSAPSLSKIEGELSAIVDELQQAVTDRDYAPISEICRTARAALSERNRLCKLNKAAPIAESITDYTTYMREAKKHLSDVERTPHFSEAKLEDIRAEFISATAKEIASLAYKDAAPVDYEEAFLKGLFGIYWDRLDGYTRKSLVSARVLLTNCSKASYDGMDFSGVVIACTSALENELKLRFLVGFQDHLYRRYGNDLQHWPKSMKYYDKKEQSFKAERVFTLGSMPKIFGGKSRVRTNNHNTVKRELKEKLSESDCMELERYLKTILYKESDGLHSFFDENSEGLSFLDRCEDIRFIYRNAAAHTEIMPKEDAEACCRDIIGQSNAANKVGYIQGLIYELVILARNPSIASPK